jgi:hypothetical protein
MSAVANSGAKQHKNFQKSCQLHDQEEAEPTILLKRLGLSMVLIILYGGDILFPDITLLYIISG